MDPFLPITIVLSLSLSILYFRSLFHFYSLSLSLTLSLSLLYPHFLLSTPFTSLFCDSTPFDFSLLQLETMFCSGYNSVDKNNQV